MLRSHPSSVFVLKYYAPVILFGGTLVFWSGGFRWAQLIVLVPLILGMFFYASLAVLQIPDGTIRYRRLFHWRKLPYDEVVECGLLSGDIWNRLPAPKAFSLSVGQTVLRFGPKREAVWTRNASVTPLHSGPRARMMLF